VYILIKKQRQVLLVRGAWSGKFKKARLAKGESRTHAMMSESLGGSLEPGEVGARTGLLQSFISLIRRTELAEEAEDDSASV